MRNFDPFVLCKVIGSCLGIPSLLNKVCGAVKEEKTISVLTVINNDMNTKIQITIDAVKAPYWL